MREDAQRKCNIASSPPSVERTMLFVVVVTRDDIIAIKTKVDIPTAIIIAFEST